MCRRHAGTSLGVHRAEAPAIDSPVPTEEGRPRQRPRESIAWAGAVPGARDQLRAHPSAGDRPAGPHLPAVRRRPHGGLGGVRKRRWVE